MKEIPLKLKRKLLEFAKKLPESRRARFLVDTAKKIVAFAVDFIRDHRYAIVYGAIGFVVGHVLDTALVFTVPFYGVLRPTANLAGILLGTAGLGYGFFRDGDMIRLRSIITSQIRKALQ